MYTVCLQVVHIYTNPIFYLIKSVTFVSTKIEYLNRSRTQFREPFKALPCVF